MNWYLISLLVFIGVAAALIFWKRNKITTKYYIFYRYDTTRGKKLIDKIAKISPRFWKIFGSIGIFVGFGAMILGLKMILKSFLRYFQAPQAFVPSISLVVPVPFRELTFAPGFLGVPFWYWIIPVAILIFFHEGMHGILARAEDIKIDTLGLFLMAIIPGAFVEPDQKQLQKSNWKSRLRIYCGGSYSNIIIGVIFLLFLTSLYLPAFYQDAVGFSFYTPGENNTTLPAQANNLTGAIHSINGKRIKNLDDLSSFLNTTEPNQTIKIKTVKGDLVAPLINTLILKKPEYHSYELELTDVDGKPTIGIQGFSKVKFSQNSAALNFLTAILVWVSILNIGVGVVNMLPLKPLDGGLVVETLCEKYLPKYSDKIVQALSFLVLFLILGNIFVAFL